MEKVNRLGEIQAGKIDGSAEALRSQSRSVFSLLENRGTKGPGNRRYKGPGVMPLKSDAISSQYSGGGSPVESAERETFGR